MEDPLGKLRDDLPAAVKIVLQKQGLSEISSAQLYQLECIVTGSNSLHQLPTGLGKTWAAIRFHILTFLTNKKIILKHENYTFKLIKKSIYQVLALQMFLIFCETSFITNRFQH